MTEYVYVVVYRERFGYGSDMDLDEVFSREEDADEYAAKENIRCPKYLHEVFTREVK